MEFPLAEYAAKHWFEHARFEGVSQLVVEGMKQLFDRTKSNLSIWIWIYDPTLFYWQRDRAEVPPPPPYTPLHYATFCGLHGIARISAISHPQDVNSQTIDNRSSPLHLASCRGYVDLTRMLIDCGADLSAQEKDGWTALHLASDYDHVDLARMLIECGADMSAQKDDGLTALHLASRRNNVDLARMLIEHGADMSVQNEYGWTALHFASRHGYLDLAQMLIERGADVSAQRKDGSTALHFASLDGHVDLTRMLIARRRRVSPEEGWVDCAAFRISGWPRGSHTDAHRARR
jgi:ankyrin repeat protein